MHLGRETADAINRYFSGNRFRTAEESLCGADEYYTELKLELDRRVIEWYEERSGKDNADELRIGRGDDGRLNIPRGLVERYGRVGTYQLLQSADFDRRWARNFSRECTYNWETFQKQPLEQLAEPEYSHGRHLLLYPAAINGDIGALSGRLQPNFSKIFFGDLVFRKKFSDHAQSVLEGVREEHLLKLKTLREKKSKKKSKKSKRKSKTKAAQDDADEIVFVGIHCRRTDHISYEQNEMGAVPVNRHYYEDAMAAFRDHFRGKGKKSKSKAKSNVHVVFVFVSDDMAWGREQLAAKNEAHSDLYFVGNGDGVDQDAIGNDLALLAACNHTIQVCILESIGHNLFTTAPYNAY